MQLVVQLNYDDYKNKVNIKEKRPFHHHLDSQLNINNRYNNHKTDEKRVTAEPYTEIASSNSNFSFHVRKI